MVHMVASTDVFVGSSATVSSACDLVPARKIFRWVRAGRDDDDTGDSCTIGIDVQTMRLAAMQR